MGITSKWAKVSEQLGPTKPKRLPYFTRTIRSLTEAGFKLATPAMAEAYEKAIGKYDKETLCWPYFEERSAASIARTEANRLGLFAYSTHSRSENIEDAIDELARIHAKDIRAGRAWLMPVLDDKECVSWDFDIAVGDEQTIIANLANKH